MKSLNIEGNKPFEDEADILTKQYQDLLADANAILFYLSNIEFQVSGSEGRECLLKDPVEVVVSSQNVYCWRDSLEAAIKNADIILEPVQDGPPDQQRLQTYHAEISENCSMANSSRDVADLNPQKSMSLSMKYVCQKSVTQQGHLSNPSKKQSSLNDSIAKDGLKLMSYQRSALVKKAKADTMIENRDLEAMLSITKK